MVYFKQNTPLKITYYGESIDDLNKMPTTTRVGSEKYGNNLAPEGAIAMILTTNGLRFYQASATGYVDITESGAGTGGGSGATIDDVDFATEGDIDNLFP